MWRKTFTISVFLWLDLLPIIHLLNRLPRVRTRTVRLFRKSSPLTSRPVLHFTSSAEQLATTCHHEKKFLVVARSRIPSHLAIGFPLIEMLQACRSHACSTQPQTIRRSSFVDPPVQGTTHKNVVILGFFN